MSEASAVLTGGVWDVVGQWSKTKLHALDSCGYKFFRAYVLGERRPPTGAMAFGRAWDGLCDGFYGEKLKSGRSLAPKDAQELFRGAFDVEADLVADWAGADMGEMVDEGAALALAWWPVGNEVQPVSVQEAFRVDLADAQGRPYVLTGRLDAIARTQSSGTEGPLFGLDDKTSGRKWGQRELWSAVDALAYSVGLDEAFGIEAAGAFTYHVAVRKKVPEVQVISRPITQADRDGFLRYVAMQRQRAMDSYRSGTWTPNRQDKLCSRRWCAWWQECEREWGGRVPD